MAGSRKINWQTWKKSDILHPGMRISRFEMVSHDQNGKIYPLNMAGDKPDLIAGFWIEMYMYGDERWHGYEMMFNHDHYCFGWEKCIKPGWSDHPYYVKDTHKENFAPARLSCRPAHTKYFADAMWFTTTDRDSFIEDMMDESYV